MVSVTSDISASTSFQAPPPRIKAEQPPASDSFASLVDSNTAAAANSNDRAQDRAQDRSQDASPAPQPAAADRRPAPSRRDDTAGTEKSRDAKADKPERNNADDRDVAAGNQADADKTVETGADKPATTKSAAAEGDESKPVEKPSSEDSDVTDTTDTQAAADLASAQTAAAVVAAIPVAVVATDAKAAAAPSTITTPPSNGPLAITAAAIAAGTAVAEPAGTPAVAAAAVNGNAANKSATSEVKADAQAVTGEAITTTAHGTPAADATATTAIALPVSTARPAAPKAAATAKASAVANDAAPSSDDADTSTALPDTPATTTATAPAAPGTEQTTAAKPNVKNAYAEPVKPETAGAQTLSVTAPHLNPAGHDAAPSQSSAQANAVQGAALQPQLQAPVTQSQPSFTVTAATQSAAVPLSGLAMEIAASVRNGKSRFEIRLDPAELGRIDVRIDVDRNGQVTSHLTVEKPETLSMLRQDAPQLHRALNDAGLSTGDSGLQFSLRDQSSSGQNGNQSNPNAQRLILTEEETVPAAVVSSYGRMLGASGALDIRV